MDLPSNNPSAGQLPLRRIVDRAVDLLEASYDSKVQLPELSDASMLGLRIALRCTLDIRVSTFFADSHRPPEAVVSFMLLVRCGIEPQSFVLERLSTGAWRDLATAAARLVNSPLILERRCFASARVAVISGQTTEEAARFFSGLGYNRNLVQAHLVSPTASTSERHKR